MSNSQSPVDAEHLRRVIEKQPSCLVRAAIDGILLAVNDAALGLLGARETCDVLGTALTARIVPEHRARWDEFAATVAADSARSLECDLTDLTGVRRRVLFHGVPLLDHPDGVPSMILGARDVSALRGLETSHEAHAHRPPESDPLAGQVQRLLEERNQLQKLLKSGRAHLEVQRAQLATMAAERQALEAQLAQREAAHQLAIADHADGQRALIEQLQREEELATKAVQQQADDLQARLAEAAAAQRRLETQLAQREAAHQEAINEQAEVQRALLEQHRREQERTAQAAQQQADDLRAQLTEGAARQRRLETQLAQRDVELIEELAAGRARVDEVLGASAQKHRQMAQELADRAVEVHYMELTAKQLAPLAVAGRLALEVGVELQRVVEAMDAQTALLLADCPPEASHRDAVEALRGDAIRARSLTSQIDRAHAATETANLSFQS